MIGVKYISPCKDHSGYGEASRNYILALHRSGVPVTVELRSFELSPPPVGTEQERAILDSLINKNIEFDVVIIHLTPDLAAQYINKYSDKYVIIYTVWETSHLHPEWVSACNQAREVWVPCQWNVDAFKDSGVTTPIYKIPHGIDSDTYLNVNTSFSIANVDKSKTFVFYSIMQWNSRKNPDGLLRAYFNTFKEGDNVCLVLKAYIGCGLSGAEDQKRIKEVVGRIKSDMQLPYFPRVHLIAGSLSSEQMKAFHLFGDAYISLTYGEGFGYTMLEAGLAGKPVIATGMGGNMEYMNETNSYPVPYSWDYVHGMGSFNRWYWGSQQWGRPSLVEASNIMRHVYENRSEATTKGLLLQSRIKEEFSWSRVVEPMVARLNEL